MLSPLLSTLQEVFVREVVRTCNRLRPVPCLVYLQGGPGFASPMPTSPPSGWQKRALKDYRVLLVDQRGTGRSGALTVEALQEKSAKEIAEHLTLFRADSIVRDVECIRKALCPHPQKLSLLSQSFGGFCALTYLSLYPENLSAVFFTGGLAPVMQSCDDVYRATYRRVVTRNKQYYARFPDDVGLVKEIVRHLVENDVQLPRGGRLTARRFLQLGLGLGRTTGLESLHWMLQGAWTSREKTSLS